MLSGFHPLEAATGWKVRFSTWRLRSVLDFCLRKLQKSWTGRRVTQLTRQQTASQRPRVSLILRLLVSHQLSARTMPSDSLFF